MISEIGAEGKWKLDRQLGGYDDDTHHKTSDDGTEASHTLAVVKAGGQQLTLDSLQVHNERDR